MKTIRKFIKKLKKRPAYKFSEELYTDGGDLVVICDVIWESSYGGYYSYKIGNGDIYEEDELKNYLAGE